MNFSHYTMISWEKYNESPEIQVNVGDILLVKTGSSYGKAALVDTLPLQSTINPQFVVLKHILCDSIFLIHLLQSGYAKKLYDAFVLGTAIPTFSQAALNEMLIPLPPLSEQRRIVTAINKWNNHISQVDKAEHDLQIIVDTCKAKVLDLAIHGKLVSQDPSDEPAIELLTRINPAFSPSHNLHYGAEIPEGWQLCNIQDIARVELGKTLDRLKDKGEEKPYLCALNVKWESFDLSTIKTLRIESSEKSKYSLRAGDLLVCEGGDVGRAAIWNSNEEMYYQNALHRVRFIDPGIMPEFFLYVLKYYKDRGIIDDISKGVTIKHFTGQVFRALDLPIPPVNEQKRIVKVVKAYYKILDEVVAGLN